MFAFLLWYKSFIYQGLIVHASSQVYLITVIGNIIQYVGGNLISHYTWLLSGGLIGHGTQSVGIYDVI